MRSGPAQNQHAQPAVGRLRALPSLKCRSDYAEQHQQNDDAERHAQQP
jgi:hypothetical protein